MRAWWVRHAGSVWRAVIIVGLVVSIASNLSARHADQVATTAARDASEAAVEARRVAEAVEAEAATRAAADARRLFDICLGTREAIYTLARGLDERQVPPPRLSTIDTDSPEIARVLADIDRLLAATPGSSLEQLALELLPLSVCDELLPDAAQGD